MTIKLLNVFKLFLKLYFCKMYEFMYVKYFLVTLNKTRFKYLKLALTGQYMDID